jgi:L-ascorbate metabolism protein UlaG (beta-lactamase superfamily)
LIELDWWQSIDLQGVAITFVPSLHWSNRYLLDKNKTLWGGFVIKSAKHTLYHAGDSGYGKQFSGIGSDLR